MERAARFDEFIRRMQSAMPPASAEQAFELLSTVLIEVEDELSGIPYRPARWRDDGRMYPPQPDSARAVDGRPELTRYRSRNHDTWIAKNGAILVRARDTGRTELDLIGADGCGIALD